MSLSWIKPFMDNLEQTFDLIKSKYDLVALTGSASIVYIILNHPSFKNDADKYLLEAGFTDNNSPADIDFLIFENKIGIIETNIGEYVSTQANCKSKTFTNPKTLKSFDITLYPKAQCMKLDPMSNIIIVSPKIMSLYYTYENREKDIQKNMFLTNNSKIFDNDEELYFVLSSKKSKAQRRTSFYDNDIFNNLDNKPIIKLNTYLFSEDDTKSEIKVNKCLFPNINKHNKIKVNKCLFSDDD